MQAFRKFTEALISKFLTIAKGAVMRVDLRTVTAAAGAATLNSMAGVVTSEAITTAAGADYVLTLTNSVIAAGDLVLPFPSNGTNTTEGLAINRVQVSAGSVIVRVRNTHASSALNGTIKIGFIVFKQLPA